MKVSELIEKLSQFDGDYEVGFWNWHTILGGGGVRHVEVLINQKADEHRLVLIGPNGGMAGHMPHVYRYLLCDTQNSYEIIKDKWMTETEAMIANGYISAYGDLWVRADMYSSPNAAGKPIPSFWVEEDDNE